MLAELSGKCAVDPCVPAEPWEEEDHWAGVCALEANEAVVLDDALALLEESGLLGDGGVLGDEVDADLDAELLSKCQAEVDGIERVASELVESDVSAWALLGAEHLLPGVGDPVFGRADGDLVMVIGSGRGCGMVILVLECVGDCLEICFACDCFGDGLDDFDELGEGGLGEQGAKVGVELLAIGIGVGAWCDHRGDLRRGFVGVQEDHGCLGPIGRREDGGFDFGEFESSPVDIDLAIGASDDEELVIFEELGAVAGDEVASVFVFSEAALGGLVWGGVALGEPRCSDTDFAFVSWGDGVPVWVDDLDADARSGFGQWEWADADCILGGVEPGVHMPAFCGAVALPEFDGFVEDTVEQGDIASEEGFAA